MNLNKITNPLPNFRLMGRQMRTGKNQTRAKNIDPHQHSALIPILLTHANLYSCLYDVFVNGFDGVDPLFTYEDYHEKTHHLDFLHQDELGLGGGLKGELGLERGVGVGLCWGAFLFAFGVK
jgi:hypothetical protein